jgi:hypothetical protein
MPRLRDVLSGAIVSVPDEKVARLGSGWVLIDTSDEAESPKAKRIAVPPKKTK